MYISSCLGSALLQGREAASHPVLLMSLNLSRNVVAMEKALRHLAEAERSLEDCSSCLVRDVIVSEAQAAEHNRSIVDAKNAYTGCLDISERQELDLSTLVYRTDGSNDAWLEASENHAGSTQTMCAAASSSLQLVDVHPEAVNLEDTDECNRQVNSSLELSLRDDDDDDDTVKEISDDGHSYAGAIIRGGLRGDSE